MDVPVAPQFVKLTELAKRDLLLDGSGTMLFNIKLILGSCVSILVPSVIEEGFNSLWINFSWEAYCNGTSIPKVLPAVSWET